MKYNTLAKIRARKRLKRILKKRYKRRRAFELYLKSIRRVPGKISYDSLIETFLPANISHLLSSNKSPLNIANLNRFPVLNNTYHVPETFSLIEAPQESYRFLCDVVSALLFQKHKEVLIDYGKCEKIDLGAQVLFDVVLKDIISFFNICKSFPKVSQKVKSISGINFTNGDIEKLLYSVGSHAIHANNSRKYKDIVPYKLCVHNREARRNKASNIAKKEIDTTELVDYVRACLQRFNRDLSYEQIADLSTIIGEILSNAEEHSTTKYRFSIGYFQDINENGKHEGVFRLVILNFGQTIYEKFKDPKCQNNLVVDKMKSLSDHYTRRSFFQWRVLNEETLWSLYALQEGITSVAPEKFRKRGNGSIQFIESFFNLRGNSQNDNFSVMTILSGNTQIIFDGTYEITEKDVEGERFKVMTFNTLGDIEDKPDAKYVKYTDTYFPGTMISAKIKFDEDTFNHGKRIK